MYLGCMNRWKKQFEWRMCMFMLRTSEQRTSHSLSARKLIRNLRASAIVPVTKANLSPTGFVVPDSTPLLHLAPSPCNSLDRLMMVSKASQRDQNRPRNRHHQITRRPRTSHSRPRDPQYHPIPDPSPHAGPTLLLVTRCG